MESTILFSERQRFRQWWLWLVVIIANGLFLYGFVQQVVFDKPIGDKPMGDTGMALSLAGTAFVTILLLLIRLDTMVKEDGIYVRFFPFHIRFKHQAWSSLARLQIRYYYPLGEYGGWGLRIGMKNGKAYTISGNKGLQLVFTNGNKLLIGTNRSEALRSVLEQLKQYPA